MRAPPTAPARAFAGAVLLPFLVTRAGLLLVAWFARQFSPSWTYHDPVGATRGWLRVPALALDVWGRYDTDWYLDLAARGYQAAPDLAARQTNLAFFPLYPALVRAGHALLPRAWQGDAARYLVAVALANALAVAALWVVHGVVREGWGDERLADRAVLYLLLFPAGFFLSCAYSESLFLLLSAAAFLWGQRGRWGRAAACAFLLGLTRPSGVLIAPALALLWLGRPPRAPRPGALAPLAVAAAPLALAAHAARLARLTGDPLALFHAQAAWHRTLSAPWTTLAAPGHAVMGPFEVAAVALFLALGLGLLRERRAAAGAYTLLSLAPVLLSGTLLSATRLLGVVFPAFVPLARAGAREPLDRAVVVLLTISQALFFFAWSRFYWVA